jgi:Tol biopolymer transport system component
MAHWSRLALVLAFLAGCDGDGGGGAAVQQMVFMQPVGGALVPDPDNAYEVAIMNLDGSGLRKLTSDGKQKFLPHFSPDATRIVYTKFSVGGYGSPTSQSDIALYDLGTSTETMLTSGGDSSQATFSPDGKRVAYGAGALTRGEDGALGLYIVNVDGSDRHRVAVWSGADDDVEWGDYAWSSDDWILFTAKQNLAGCFRVRLDKIRPDGSSRTKVTDGGPSCTPMGFEQSGDADPGWSADGRTIYSSRGFPVPPAGMMAPTTERKLYAFASDAWAIDKPESDLSLPSEPSCIEGVPKGSPDGQRVLLFRACFEAGLPKPGSVGIYVTDTAGSYRTFVTEGFGPDWNPLAR